MTKERAKTVIALTRHIGKVMGALYFRVLEPLWQEHPELAPPQPSNDKSYRP